MFGHLYTSDAFAVQPPVHFSDSVSAHIEEPCEVPEGSMSSTFFHKYSALSPSSQGSVLLQDKKIIDALEINLQDHSLVYFDFDLRKKLILLLHLLFILSVMTVRCSQISNTLTLLSLFALQITCYCPR